MIQGNMVTTFGFLRTKIWENMPEIFDDSESIFWVVLFSVGFGLAKVHAPAASGEERTQKLDYLFLPRIPDYHLHHDPDHFVLL